MNEKYYEAPRVRKSYDDTAQTLYKVLFDKYYDCKVPDEIATIQSIKKEDGDDIMSERFRYLKLMNSDPIKYLFLLRVDFGKHLVEKYKGSGK